jgi:hypothetical protein
LFSGTHADLLIIVSVECLYFLIKILGLSQAYHDGQPQTPVSVRLLAYGHC